MKLTGTCPAVLLLIFVMGLLAGCDWPGGAFEREPEDIGQLGSQAKALIADAYDGIETSELIDYHTHMLGLDTRQYGTFVNKSWQNPFNLPDYARFIIYKSAAGITDLGKADRQYMERLKRLIRHLPHRGKFGLMAFDYFHDEQGKPDLMLSTFHVPNRRMMQVVAAHPDYFFPVISVHPYREDAVLVLTDYAQQGARFVKWLPNSMGIDPASEKPALKQKLEAYYNTMTVHGMVLVTHTGDEKAIAATDSHQRYGNPLRLEKPLSMGVTVIMSHLASLGKCSKADRAICQPGTEYIDLAINMLRDRRYNQRLYADISAVIQFNRKNHLDRILAATDIHDRLVNGSDYPLPAVNFFIRLGGLVKSGHITAQERELLDQIYDVNPLLFDFVLKRTVRHSRTGQRFATSVFTRHLTGN